MQVTREIRQIHSIIDSAGFELYIVGGAVRNSILGIPISDWDFASNALPQDIMRLFHRVIPTGIEHGTVAIRFKGKNYEITTYRIDGKYRDTRHPESVTFTSSIEEDLRRRDFTINAMAYDLLENKILDPFLGQKDIQNKVIRTVGNPKNRFSEDALRMLRALRFASQLSFQIDAESLLAMQELHASLANISVERIREELNKILLSKNPNSGLQIARNTNILQYLCPKEFYQDPKKISQYIATCMAIKKQDAGLRFAALFSALPSKMLRAHCHSLKYPNAFTKRVCHLIENAYFPLRPASDSDIRIFLSKVGIDNFQDILSLRMAIVESNSRNKQELELLKELRLRARVILEMTPPLSITDLAVGGNDLYQELGIPKNKMMRYVLEELLSLVLIDPLKNNRETLLNLAHNIYLKNL